MGEEEFNSHPEGLYSRAETPYALCSISWIELLSQTFNEVEELWGTFSFLSHLLPGVLWKWFAEFPSPTTRLQPFMSQIRPAGRYGTEG